MYLLATICLLNFLTVRGTEETVQDTWNDKFQKARINVEGGTWEGATVAPNDAYTQCVRDLTEKKYKEADDAKWAENTDKAKALKARCIDSETQICQWTNGIMTKLFENVKGQEQEICTDMRKSTAFQCKSNIIGNDFCKADCEKISPAADKPSSAADKTVFTKAMEKYAEERVKVVGNPAKGVAGNDEYNGCFKAATEKKYEKTKWEQKNVGENLKLECYDQEAAVCVVTNKTMKKFIDGLKGQEQEICTDVRKAEVLKCKAALISNKDCKADCDKLSSASTLTTTVLFLSALAFISM